MSRLLSSAADDSRRYEAVNSHRVRAMNSRWNILFMDESMLGAWKTSKLLAALMVGVGLAWSAARGGPNGDASPSESPVPPGAEKIMLPDVPAPRYSSSMLPMPRLERMANTPSRPTQRRSLATATLISGPQLSAWMRGGLALPKLRQIDLPGTGTQAIEHTAASVPKRNVVK